MKLAEYREMSAEQLDLSLKDVVKNLFHLRFQSATERLETPSEIRKAKREVARIQTLQRAEQLVQGLLGRLPEAEAARIRGLPKGRQLTAAQIAVKKVAKEK
ncbi:MAG TPA: 50S ribosomal protein L29 [Gemmataceae bacterium]|jgi:large subunit ribosomal protein L29|nr:50S ribosomal protein L29 [Gemmataceae bacterium]